MNPVHGPYASLVVLSNRCIRLSRNNVGCFSIGLDFMVSLIILRAAPSQEAMSKNTTPFPLSGLCSLLRESQPQRLLRKVMGNGHLYASIRVKDASIRFIAPKIYGLQK